MSTSPPRVCPICHVPTGSPEHTYCERHRGLYVHWDFEGCGSHVTQHVSVDDGQRRCSQCQAKERAAQLSRDERDAILLALHQGGRLSAIKEARHLLNLSLADAMVLVGVLE